jgi:hypothetical protein
MGVRMEVRTERCDLVAVLRLSSNLYISTSYSHIADISLLSVSLRLMLYSSDGVWPPVVPSDDWVLISP